MTYAPDSNIISYMLKKDRHVCERYLEESAAGHECIIPPVVYYEIKRGLLYSDATAKSDAFDVLCREFGVGEMSMLARNEAARQYAGLRRAGRLPGDDDILIAAFCIVNGYTLVTNNTKHYADISGLQMVNWSEGKE